MPKLKTHSSSKKRFNLTGTGKVKRNKAFKAHLLSWKKSKRKRGLRQSSIASSANANIIKKMIPYK